MAKMTEKMIMMVMVIVMMVRGRVRGMTERFEQSWYERQPLL
jgi:hypothetical protein